MQTQQDLYRFQAKQVVYALKTLAFCPHLSYFAHFPSFSSTQIGYYLKIDFNDHAKIFDIVAFFEIFSTRRIFENIVLKMQASLLSSKISHSINKMLGFFNLNSLELDFAINYKRCSPNLIEILGSLRFLESLRIFRLNLENVFASEEIITSLGKGIQNLSLSELYLNLNKSSISAGSLIKLSLSIAKISQLSKLNLSLRNNELSLSKDDLIQIFKSLRNLKILTCLHLNLKLNPIQIIDAIFIVRKCLKQKIFPKLQEFNFNANYLQNTGFNQGKFMYYLQRKSASFHREQPHNELRSLVLKFKKNEFSTESIIIFLTFFKKMSQLTNMALLLKENRISFKIYLQFLFKINIESLCLDFCQFEKELMPQINSLQASKVLERTKKLNLKFKLFSNTSIEEMLQSLRNFSNLEELTLSLISRRSFLSKENNAIILFKSFPKLRRMKLTLINETNDLNEVGVSNVFQRLRSLKMLQNIDFTLSLQPGLSLDGCYGHLVESLAKLKILNKFKLCFLSVSKVEIRKETRTALGNAFLKLKNFVSYVSDDEKLNQIFRQKYRMSLIAWVMKKELQTTLKRRKILEEIFFLFI